MNILLILIPISLVLLLVAIFMFVWAVKKGQFENLESAALDILVDEETVHDAERETASPAHRDAD